MLIIDGCLSVPAQSTRPILLQESNVEDSSKTSSRNTQIHTLVSSNIVSKRDKDVTTIRVNRKANPPNLSNSSGRGASKLPGISKARGGSGITSFPRSTEWYTSHFPNEIVKNDMICLESNGELAFMACTACRCIDGVMWGCLRDSPSDLGRYLEENSNYPVPAFTELYNILPDRTWNDIYAPETWCKEHADCICVSGEYSAQRSWQYNSERFRLARQVGFDPHLVHRYPDLHYMGRPNIPNNSDDPNMNFNYPRLSLLDPNDPDLSRFPFFDATDKGLRKRDFTGGKIINSTKDFCWGTV